MMMEGKKGSLTLIEQFHLGDIKVVKTEGHFQDQLPVLFYWTYLAPA